MCVKLTLAMAGQRGLVRAASLCWCFLPVLMQAQPMCPPWRPGLLLLSLSEAPPALGATLQSSSMLKAGGRRSGRLWQQLCSPAGECRSPKSCPVHKAMANSSHYGSHSMQRSQPHHFVLLNHATTLPLL